MLKWGLANGMIPTQLPIVQSKARMSWTLAAPKRCAKAA